MKKHLQVWVGLLVICVMTQGKVLAAGTGSDAMQSSNPEAGHKVTSLYEQGVIADKRGDFQQAVELFEKALSADPDNADILNMLAHSQRKLGKLGEAIANYKKALKIRPNFAEAREYLGEAYIQAALEEIKTLKSYGVTSEEDLEDLTKDFKEAAAKL